MAKQHSKSIVQDEKECYLTHVKYDLVRHHLMNGNAERKKAEQDGLWVWLNDSVHKYLHDTHEGRMKMYELKAIAQEAYEETHSHEEWMRRYGKNDV